jgi:hypothetical protein
MAPCAASNETVEPFVMIWSAAPPNLSRMWSRTYSARGCSVIVTMTSSCDTGGTDTIV